MRTQRLSEQIVYTRGRPVDIHSVRFLGNGGPATVSGFFIDASGDQCSVLFSGTVPAAGGTDSVGFADLFGADVPTVAVGARVRASADVWWCAPGQSAALITDFKTGFAKALQLVAGEEAGFGQVG